jgi:Fe-S cluster assembly scaffold protein SufB
VSNQTASYPFKNPDRDSFLIFVLGKIAGKQSKNEVIHNELHSNSNLIFKSVSAGLGKISAVEGVVAVAG